jgi:hypothetical protein
LTHAPVDGIIGSTEATGSELAIWKTEEVNSC